MSTYLRGPLQMIRKLDNTFEMDDDLFDVIRWLPPANEIIVNMLRQMYRTKCVIMVARER